MRVCDFFWHSHPPSYPAFDVPLPCCAARGMTRRVVDGWFGAGVDVYGGLGEGEREGEMRGGEERDWNNVYIREVLLTANN